MGVLRRGVGAAGVVAMVTLAIGAPPAIADSSGPDAPSLAATLTESSSLITAASYLKGPPGPAAVAVGTTAVAGFPRQGDDYAILSSGQALDIFLPNAETNLSTDFGGTDPANPSVRDVTTLRVDLNVPKTANCLLGVDFAFFSEEFPEYVGSSYNDALIIEVDESTWTVSGNTISAPHNIAFDETGNPITINAAGSSSMSEEKAAGTTYDGGTSVLTTATPMTPGPHSLFFTVFDVSDGVFDSTALIDNIRVGAVADVATDCKSGAVEARPDDYVALGDSYSSGFGVAPYEAGTHVDDGNDCQRSTTAYSHYVEESLGITRSFEACQGAETRDFYSIRDERSTWGEIAQLEHLSTDTALVTFSIGGNDSGFADVLADCILGWELLPFNTCHGDERITTQVGDGIAALKGDKASGDIHSYDEIFESIIDKAPFADVVAVGYPHFYEAEGSDRTFLPGGRCEGVKKADQRWIVEQIDEINTVLSTSAARNGFLFANPVSRFAGHELCSEGDGDEWVYGILAEGKLHPTGSGQAAIGDEVNAVLDTAGLDKFTLKQGQTLTRAYIIESGITRTTVVVRWPGSTVETTLVSPSGVEYSADNSPVIAGYSAGPASERFELVDPEPGEWTVKMYGADLDPAGEQVSLRTSQQSAPNERPVGDLSIIRDGASLHLDSSDSADVDGQIVSTDWYVESADDETVHTDPTLTVDVPEFEPVSVTLVVTDDEGLTDFVTTAVPAATLDSPRTVTSAHEQVRVALLGSPEFAATDVDLDSLTWGPGGSTAAFELDDIDENGYDDVVAISNAGDLNLSAGSNSLCVAGALTDERDFASCVALALDETSPAVPLAPGVPTASPTPTPAPSLSPEVLTSTTNSSPIPAAGTGSAAARPLATAGVNTAPWLVVACWLVLAGMAGAVIRQLWMRRYRASPTPAIAPRRG